MKLEVVSGPTAGTTLECADELMIGRSAEGPGQLGGDSEISRVHARLAVDSDGAFSVEDMGSTNGTYVNGLRITATQPLAEGDTLEMGSTVLVVRELPTSVEEPAGVPPLNLRLEVDIAGREVRLWLDGRDTPMRFTPDDDGGWGQVPEG